MSENNISLYVLLQMIKDSLDSDAGFGRGGL